MKDANLEPRLLLVALDTKFVEVPIAEESVKIDDRSLAVWDAVSDEADKRELSAPPKADRAAVATAPTRLDCPSTLLAIDCSADRMPPMLIPWQLKLITKTSKRPWKCMIRTIARLWG